MIYGINPTSLIDYPGHLSLVVFTGGCNFKCPFCHNKEIVNKTLEEIPEDKVLAMLKQRKGFINHVTITGGEPSIYGERLATFITNIKELGYLIKLDTNGSNPEFIEKLLKEHLIDYIAMDIKNTLEKYNETVGTNINLSNILKSIKMIENIGISYEFRSTVNRTMHTEDDIKEMEHYVCDKSKFILQRYRYTKNQLIDQQYGEYTDDDLINMKKETEVLVR